MAGCARHTTGQAIHITEAREWMEPQLLMPVVAAQDVVIQPLDALLLRSDDHFQFQIAENECYGWAYSPVDFTPYEINFDVYTQPGPQDGAFGVFCHLQDAANCYYVELDMQDGSYLIGQIVNDEGTPLTAENVNGKYWHFAAPLNLKPGATNRIGVGCYLDTITLFVKGE